MSRTVVSNPPPLTPRGTHPVRPFPFSWLRQFAGLSPANATKPAPDESQPNPARYE